jgi:glycerate 2-kinase
MADFISNPETFLRELFDVAVAAADPLKCIPPHLPAPPLGRTVVLGAGKASAAMAKAVEDNWSGELSGLVVTRYGFGVDCSRIEIVEAAHPVPDAAGLQAARRIIDLALDLKADDLCIALISGGASSLLSCPAEGLTLEDKQAVNRALLRSGADITEMNCVRKHLSAIKGGRLAEAVAPARLVTLLISDVVGNHPGVIGSGPTVPDDSTFSEALAVIEKYGIELPESVARHLQDARSETPKQGDAIFENASTILAGLPKTSLTAAGKVASDAGINVIDLGDELEGESRDIARDHAKLALDIKNGTGPVFPPVILLSGGETTVTLSGDGKGGPNGEYALALAIALEGTAGVYALSCDTDGIDGSEDNAGAMITPETLQHSREMDLDASGFLQNNDSYGFFERAGGLVITGPTCTNVNDFRAVLVLS